jgi:Bacterial extracellular solute-binding protein, family 7
VKGFGASAVAIAFGEVVPALEKGVVDCGITGTMPAYKAKWTEVTNTLFRLPVGVTAALWLANINAWNKLSPATQEFLKKEFNALEDKSWKTVEAETEDGVYCTTGTGNCPAGPPGKLKLVKPSEADLKARDKVLNDLVLKEWAKRCGEACAVTCASMRSMAPSLRSCAQFSTSSRSFAWRPSSSHSLIAPGSWWPTTCRAGTAPTLPACPLALPAAAVVFRLRAVSPCHCHRRPARAPRPGTRRLREGRGDGRRSLPGRGGQG